MLIGWPKNPAPGTRPRPQPLLSWRVMLLPFLEQDNLYREFKLDEPWDSEHNKKLLSRMPKVFAPVRAAAEPGMTYYQVFVGQNAPFPPLEMLQPPFAPGGPAVLPKGGPRIPATIPDGTSNTFLVVEAGEPVPWTKPADLEYDDKKPVPKLGGLFPDGFHAAAFSAEIYFIPRDLKEKDLRHLINPADGEVIETPLKALSDRDDAPAAAANANEKGDVRGKVSFQGKPLPGGTIRFVGEQAFAASIAPDGSYELRDVPAATYRIAIGSMTRAPGNRGNAEHVPIPDRYQDPNTSGLQTRVGKGQNTFNIELN
jgi:hypothetical protein